LVKTHQFHILTTNQRKLKLHNSLHNNIALISPVEDPERIKVIFPLSNQSAQLNKTKYPANFPISHLPPTLLFPTVFLLSCPIYTPSAKILNRPQE
jgi:hypothetical protein